MEREEIGSSRNPLVKEVAALKLKKERQRQGLYLAEGVRQDDFDRVYAARNVVQMDFKGSN